MPERKHAYLPAENHVKWETMISLKDVRYDFADSNPRHEGFSEYLTENLQRLKESGQPELGEFAGQNCFIIQDYDSYRKMLQLLDQAEAIVALQGGIESINRGEGRLFAEFSQEMMTRQKINSCSAGVSPATAYSAGETPALQDMQSIYA